MPRYIEANAYIKYCEENWIPLNVDAVNKQPTADVVERKKVELPDINYYNETVYGFKLQDLIKIAVILQSAGLSPDDATRALHDIDLIVDACRKEFFEGLHIIVSDLL